MGLRCPCDFQEVSLNGRAMPFYTTPSFLLVVELEVMASICAAILNHEMHSHALL